MKRIIINAIVLLSLILGVLWFAYPATMSRLLLSVNNASAGLTSKVIDTQIGPIHYLEGGKNKHDAPTLIFLHGIYARKEHWVDVVRELNGQFHIIALDLPGFGDNQTLAREEYYLDKQADNLSIVLDALLVTQAHVGANSMGAQVAGILAVKRPNLFKTLAFIGSPLGVPTKVKSDMELALSKGGIPLLVTSEADFNRRNDWLFPHIPFIPAPIMDTWMNAELANVNKNTEIWHAVQQSLAGVELLKIAPQINTQSLIIWCEEDRIFHVSGAELLDKTLAFSQKRILKQCGHVPMLDKPKEVAQVYASFLDEFED